MNRSFFACLLVLPLVFSGLLKATCFAIQVEPIKSVTQAPFGYEPIQPTFGGQYYIPQTTFREYERIKNEFNEHQRLGGSKAEQVGKLELLVEDLNDIEKRIEAEKILVSPHELFAQTDEYEFDLGADETILFVGDYVEAKGYDGDKIRVVCNKLIFGNDEPSKEEFEAIQIEHQLEIPSIIVGKSPAQRLADEKEYLAGEDSRKLTLEQQLSRQEFLDEIKSSFAAYAGLQGRTCNVLRIRGLSFQDGNRHLIVRTSSQGGSDVQAGQWNRQARIRLYVPRCKQFAIFGAQRGTNLVGLKCNVIVSSLTSKDRDYSGHFSMENIDGNISVVGAPMQSIRNIRGSVSIDAVYQMRNGGTMHQNGTRRSYADTSTSTIVESVTGSLTANFIHTKLSLKNIEGPIDVRNAFGQTQLSVDSKTSTNVHRILSDSGSIQVQGPASDLERLRLTASTAVGEMTVSLPQNVLEESLFSSKGKVWRSFRFVQSSDDPSKNFARMERVDDAIANRKREPGLDLISRAGTIVIE